MNPYELMEAKKSSLTKKELLIYDNMKSNADEILRGGIVEVANIFKVSQPTVTRFCQKLGYEGFNDFKFDLYRASKQNLGKKEESKMAFPTLESYNRLINKMDMLVDKSQLKQFAKSIVKARRVIVMGRHKSRLGAELLRYNLIKFGINCTQFSGDDAQEIIHVANQDDLIIVISAQAISCKDTIKELMEHNVPTALVTMNEKATSKSSFKHFIWLPNYKNQTEDVYTENVVLFSIFIDLLTSFIAEEV